MRAVAGQANPPITLKRYSHLLDARVTEAAERFDPARVELGSRLKHYGSGGLLPITVNGVGSLRSLRWFSAERIVLGVAVFVGLWLIRGRGWAGIGVLLGAAAIL